MKPENKLQRINDTYLSRLQQSLENYIKNNTESNKYNYGFPLVINKSCNLSWENIYIVEPPNTNTILLRLPEIKRNDNGRFISVFVNSDLDTDVNVISSSPKQTINNSNDIITINNYERNTFLANNENWLNIDDYNSSSGLTESELNVYLDSYLSVYLNNYNLENRLIPIWEWNGTDTTQFGSITIGNAVTSAVASVVSAFGVNWLQIVHTENYGGGGSSTANRSAFLPITESFDSDVLIVAEVYVDTIATSSVYTGWGLATRFDDTAGSTTPGTGAVVLHLPNNATGRYIKEYTATTDNTIRGESGFLFAHTGTIEMDVIKHKIVGDAVITANITGVEMGGVDGSINTTGKVGLISLVGGSSSPGSGIIRFRNIKVYGV